MNSGSDKRYNFEMAKKYVLNASKKWADIVCLPELFLYWWTCKLEESWDLSSKYVSEFQNIARSNNINIVLGSMSLDTEVAYETTNSSLIIDRSGKIVHRYDKIYMFNVIKEDFVVRESNETRAGKNIGLFELDGIKMGVWICYDLRYPEYFQKLAINWAEIIFLPANFRKITGKIAWDILTKARAIENQVYFCGCGQTWEDGVKERCGNTRIVSFDGKIISEIEKKEWIIFADLDLDNLRKFRKEFPVLKQVKN